jgi:hypothetical protein
MSFGTARKSSFDLALQPVETEGRTDVFVLLPTLEELLGHPEFGRRNPIFLPGHARPLERLGPVRLRARPRFGASLVPI